MLFKISTFNLYFFSIILLNVIVLFLFSINKIYISVLLKIYDTIRYYKND